MSSSQAVSKEALDLLVSMGFTEEESRAALLATQGDANAAIEMLSRGDGKKIKYIMLYAIYIATTCPSCNSAGY